MASKMCGDTCDNKTQISVDSISDSDAEDLVRKTLGGSAELNRTNFDINIFGQCIKSRDDFNDLKIDDQHSTWSAGLSAEDKKSMETLYQEHPTLRGDFDVVTRFMELMHYGWDKATSLEIAMQLERVYNWQGKQMVKARQFCTFAAVVGFVEACVGLYRRVMTIAGQTYIVDMSWVNADKELKAILRLARKIFFNFSVESKEFSLRLLRTGFLNDLCKDLQHMQYLAADALEEHTEYVDASAAIYNCCTHPELIPLVKESGAMQLLLPFSAKRGGTQFVQTMATMAVSLMLEDHEADLLRLQPPTLLFVVSRVRGAITAGSASHDGWLVSALLTGLWRLARCHYNKRLLVAHGTVETVKCLLTADGRTNEEKLACLNILRQLAGDSDNVTIFQNDRKLKRVLRELKSTTDLQVVKDAVMNIEAKIPPRMHTGPEDLDTFPRLSELLSGDSNILSILGQGEVEYVMEQLHLLADETGESHGNSDVTRMKILQAIEELSGRDEASRREFMARGVLDQLTKVLQTGNRDERTECASILQLLALSAENRDIIQNETNIKESLGFAAGSSDKKLAETANFALKTLNDPRAQ